MRRTPRQGVRLFHAGLLTTLCLLGGVIAPLKMVDAQQAPVVRDRVPFPPGTTWQQAVDQIYKDHWVKVDFENVTFPPSWLQYGANWQPVPEDQRLAALERLRFDLSPYDRSFLRNKAVTYVFLVSLLSTRGRRVATTYEPSGRVVYMVHTWAGDNEQRQYLLGFHHEVAAILFTLNRSQFPEAEWRAQNASGFAYDADSKANPSTGRNSRLGDEKLYADGFLCDYARASLESDFKTYVELAIAHPVLARSLAGRYPRIQGKLRLMEAYLAALGFKPQARYS